MRFKEHRGGLSESMTTVVEVANRAALLEHLRRLLSPYPRSPPITDETVHVTRYGWDDRIGWDVHIVTLDGYGVLGFTDGPMRPDPPGPTGLIRFSIGMLCCALAVMVFDLYRGAWVWAVVQALSSIVNVLNAYFNTLPLSVRARILFLREERCL